MTCAGARQLGGPGRAPRLRGGKASFPGSARGLGPAEFAPGEILGLQGGAGHLPAHPMPGARSSAGGAATLELELEFGGAGGQRLLQAGPGAENESEAVASVRSSRAQSVLRWFTTVVLCAAFLGLVRAGLNPSRPRLEQASCREPGLLSALRCA